MSMLTDLDLRSCSLVVPSWNIWKVALGVHLTQSIVGLGLVGFLLFQTLSAKRKEGSGKSTRTTQYLGIFFAVTLCAAAPISAILLSQTQTVHWIVVFLLSVFGNCVFFKALSAAFGTYPEGADRDLSTWMLWFTSLPEPLFCKGNIQPAPSMGPIVFLFIFKTVACGAFITVLKAEHNPFQATWSSGDGDVLWDSAMFLLDSLLHLWWLFTFCSLCMDVGVLMVALQGKAAEEPYSKPLLVSRSYKECWGIRWNRPYHLFFKRTVYVPARMAGYSKFMSSILTFLVSGLVHEYNFFVHNYRAYIPGQGLKFFAVAGVMMVAEEIVPRLLFRKEGRIMGLVRRTPSFVICFCLILPILPFYEKLFFDSWLKAGMIEDVSIMLPHLHCNA